MAEKEYKTMKDQMESGAILSAWTLKNGISIVPCPDIDKVRISIVAKGTKGQDHNDHYIDFEEFRQFCNDIDSGTALQRFQKDTVSDFPTAYEFSSGKQKDDGSMTITSKCSFGAGKKGPAVQVNNLRDGKWSNKMVGLTMKQIRTMSFMFKLISGVIPVHSGGYYDQLYKAFWTGNEKRKAYHSDNGNNRNTPTPSAPPKTDTGSSDGFSASGEWDEDNPFV